MGDTPSQFFFFSDFFVKIHDVITKLSSDPSCSHTNGAGGKYLCNTVYEHCNTVSEHRHMWPHANCMAKLLHFNLKLHYVVML